MRTRLFLLLPPLLVLSSLSPGALVGHWPLDGSAADTAGSHNGTFTGTSAYVAGPIGQAAFLDGASYIQLGVGVQRLTAYTKSAWVRRTADAANHIFSGVSGHAFVAGSGTGSRLCAGHNGAWQSVQTAQALALDTWVHVAVTYDAAREGGTLRLYTNGALVAGVGGVATNVAHHLDTAAQIGAFNGTNCFQGQIDDVGLWDEALGAADIQALYQGGLGGRDLGSVAFSAPVAFTACPRDLQLYPRDVRSNAAVVRVAGTVVSNGYDAIVLRVYRSGVSYAASTGTLSYAAGGAPFEFAQPIPAELADYRFEIRLRAGASEILVRTVYDVAAGDVYVIQGQSNAEAALYSGTANGNRHPFLRTYGQSSEDANRICNSPGWIVATGDGSLNVVGGVGQWGLRFGRRLVEAQGLPVAIFNGAHGGQAIGFFQRNDANPTNLTTNYGRLLYRLRKAGVTDGVRAVLWYQGESDNGNGAVHEAGFLALRQDWREDLPNLERTYIHQLRVGCGVTKDQVDLRDRQRRLPDVYGDLSVMSTTGINGHNGCHYDYQTGYRVIADHLFALVARDLYGAPDLPNLEAPNISQAYFSDALRREVTLVTRNPTDTLAFDAGATSDLLLYGTAATVVSGRAAGNAVVLTLSGPADGATGIAYTDHSGSGGWITNTLGVGLLAFSAVPIDVILGAPTLDNAGGATNVTATAADLNGTLGSTGGAVTAVSVFWSPADGGTNPAVWLENGGARADLGARAAGALALQVNGLSPHTTYHYRYYATNLYGGAWAAPSARFTTTSFPVVDNAGGAESVGAVSATLTGNLGSGGVARVIACLGRQDGVWTRTQEVGVVAEGPFSFGVADLVPATRYYYRCRASNDTGAVWAPASAAFVTESLPFAAWHRFLPIGLTGYEGAETLTNFPALVVLGPNRAGFAYDQFASPQGDDLRFVDASLTNELSYEIDEWNPNGLSFVWVRVPRLSGGGPGIRAYWGKGGVTRPAYAADGSTWDAGFRGVYHLNEIVTDEAVAGTHADATANRFNGKQSGNDEVAAVIGRGQAFDGNDLINLGGVMTANPYTKEAWVRVTTSGNLIGGGTGGSDHTLWVPGTQLQAGHNSDWTGLVDPATFPFSSWQHVAVTYAAGNFTLYRNGRTVASRTGYAAPNLGTVTYFGAYAAGNCFAGQIDEGRISSVARSASWINAVYLNTLSNDFFNGYGPVQVGSPLVNNEAVGITGSSAQLGAYLWCSGQTVRVWVYWGEADGGTEPGAWTNRAFVGQYAAATATNVQFDAANLQVQHRYFFTFRATNEVLDLWAPQAGVFTTPGPPSVTNTGAADLGGAGNGTARLGGRFLDENRGEVTICWGLADAGTNSVAAWQHAEPLGIPSAAEFTQTVSGLLYPLTYCYRCYVSNAYGSCWSDPASRFTMDFKPVANRFPPPAALLANVPEAGDYDWVYELNIPASSPGWNGVPVNYSVDHAAAITNGSFGRVAYYLELTPSAGATAQWVYVAMDAFTTNAARIGVPTTGSGAFYRYGSPSISNATIRSNVGGIVTGNAINTVNLEFWPSNYGQANDWGVPGASGTLYDFGDGGANTTSGHGSMQIHNYGAGQTLFGYSSWGVARPSELGIGNQVGGNPDWTFNTTNITNYVSRVLRVLVRPRQLLPALGIANRAASDVGVRSARLEAALSASGAVYEVWAYWGLTDHTNDWNAWEGRTLAGTFSNAIATISCLATGLTPDTRYSCTFRATNALDDLWAGSATNFITVATPAVDNASGATVTVSRATLHGNLTAGNSAEVRLYWGRSDGGTNRAGWQNVAVLPSTPQGPFAVEVPVGYGATYYYRAYATNAAGDAWAPGSASFSVVTRPQMGEFPGCSSLLANVPEARAYCLVYRLPIPVQGNWNNVAVPYSVNNVGSIATGSFSRIAYYLELTTGAVTQWVYTSMSAFTNNAAKTGVPNLASGETYYHGNYPPITNATIRSNVGSIGSGDGTNTLNLEFWPINYGQTNAHGVPGADATIYDFGDQESGGTYGSMQIHNYGARQTLFAYNNWNSGSTSDLGIGNRPTSHPDWTFAYNAGSYSARALEVLVGPYELAGVLHNAPPSNLTPTSAVFNATLRAPGWVYDVYAYWGLTDGSTNAAAWSTNAYVGTCTDVVATNLAFTAPGIAPESTYWYTFMLSNAVERLWATPSQQFASLGALQVTNGAPAAVSSTAATIGAGVLTGGAGQMTIFWGPADGGSTATAWAHRVDFETRLIPHGGVTNLSGLLANQVYYYRAYATNGLAGVWAEASTNFATGLATLSIGDAVVVEGDSGTTNAVFPLTLSARSGRPVSVRYVTGGGTATADADYARTEGTQVIAAGALSDALVVPVTGDAEGEWPSETFLVTLSNPVDVLLLDDRAVGTILDDDVPAYLMQFASRLKIVFSGYPGPEPLTNFPALIRLGPQIAGFQYENFASDTGAELQFADAGLSTVLSHEIEKWDRSGVSTVWVRVPVLKPGTTIWALWGHPGLRRAALTAPTDLPGCELWLDADDVNAFSFTLGGAGGAVTRWADKSGRGHHLDGVLGDPKRLAGRLNGAAVVNFDGNDMLWSTYNFDALVDYSIITVARYTGPDTFGRVIASRTQNWLFGFYGGGNERWFANNWIYQGGTAGTNWLLHAGTLGPGWTNPPANFWVNGSLRATNNYGSHDTSYLPGALQLGGYGGGAGTEMSKSEVAEVILYNRTLSDAEMNRVGYYLALKYGLSTAYTPAGPLFVAPSVATDGSTWSARYQGVWHLQNLDGWLLDSTGYRNDGTPRGLVTLGQAGWAAEAAVFHGGTNGADRVEMANSASLQDVQESNYTVSAWFCPTTLPPGTGSVNDASYAILMKQGNHGGLQFNNNGTLSMTHWLAAGPAATAAVSAASYPTGTFQHVAGVVDRTAGSVKLYVNGALAGTRSFTPNAAAYEYGVNPWRIGMAQPGAAIYRWAADGVVDEARLSGVARSPNWILAEYLAAAAPDTFVRYRMVNPPTLLLVR